MTDFPLPRIFEFIRKIFPFDTLTREELGKVVAQMEISYYPRDTVIIQHGDEVPSHLYIIQKGTARITIPDYSGKVILIDVRGKGDVFGVVSILKGAEALFDITAVEDIIAYRLPAKVFKNLVFKFSIFRQYFDFSFARNIKSIRRVADPMLPQITGTIPLNIHMFLVGKQVAELMVTDVVTCSPKTSIRTAAKQMAKFRVGSIVIEEKPGHPVGILTDRDLRSRVIAAGIDINTPVLDVMNRPLHTIHSNAYPFDALLDMSHHGVSHLIVTEDNKMVGIISDHDFQMELGSSPLGVIGDIDKSKSVNDLASLHSKIDRVLEMLLRQGGSVQKMVELITELNDRLTLRLLKLAEREIEKEGLGSPPVPYCWILMGSEGRREQTLHTDQDNALVFANVSPKDEKAVKRWFLLFSERVVDGLERCGFPRCAGGIMASNPRWCQCESKWQETFLEWIKNPNSSSLRMASIFFDFRPLYGNTDFLNSLRAQLNTAIRQNRLFLRFLAKNGLHNRPPLGFLRQFVVEKSGEHKNNLNLKMKGRTPIVDAIRVIALDLGVNATNTLERMIEINKRGVITDNFYSDLREAYIFISYLIVNQHIEARARGKDPKNFVDPRSLNTLQRKMLKESFAVINKLQELLEFSYQTQVLTEA